MAFLLPLMKEAWQFAKKFVFDPPKNLAAAIWRGVALWMITTSFAVGWIFTQNPSVVRVFTGSDKGSEIDDLITDVDGSTQIENLINDFIYRHQPTRFAFVARVSTVGVKLLWSNQDASHWPTSVEGIMSSNMKPVIGHLIFDSCWSGSLDGSDSKWIFCGISDSDKNYGYLVSSWPPESGHGDKNCAAELKALAQRISEILF